MRRREVFRRDALFDPAHHGGEYVDLRVTRQRGLYVVCRAKGCSSWPALEELLVRVRKGSEATNKAKWVVSNSVCSISAKSIPVLHPTNGKQPIEIVNLHLRILSHEPIDRLIVVERIARADELVSPPHVVDDLAVMVWASKR